MFEAVQFIEYRGVPEPEETHLGDFGEETDAVEAARGAREQFVLDLKPGELVEIP